MSGDELIGRDRPAKTGAEAGETSKPTVDEQLIESERLLRSVLETAVDAIITIDQRGKIESFNPAAEAMFGYLAEEVIGKNVNHLMPPPYRDEHAGYLRNYLTTGEEKIIGIGREVEGLRKNGEVFPMDLAVSEVRLPDRRLFTGVVRDITQRKASEAAVLESQRRLATLISNLPGAAFRCQVDEKWTLEFVSSGCLDLCGYSEQELLSENPSWKDLVEPDDRDDAAGQIQAKLELKQPYRIIYRLRHRNGEQRRVWEQGQGVYSDDGQLVALEGFISDTTELQKAREKLVQSERLAAMGQMLSGIAHESRNALQRIQASVDMLGFEIEKDSEAAEDVARIARARGDLQRLFEELRNFAAPIHLEWSTADLAQIWKLAWSHLESVIGDREVEFVSDTNCLDLECRVDAFRIEQVFRNLMENSLSACADPVRIEVQCQPISFEGRPAISVVFRDNGPGLTEEQRKRVFEAFFTTKTKGTGLGMAIAKRIMESHGGTMRVGLGHHGGAEFELIFPRRAS